MTELKLCPFCGGADKHDADCYIPMLVECVERELFLEPDYENKLEEAWNTRAERTCHFRNDGHGILWCDAQGCDYEMDDYLPIPKYCPNCGAKVVG